MSRFKFRAWHKESGQIISWDNLKPVLFRDDELRFRLRIPEKLPPLRDVEELLKTTSNYWEYRSPFNLFEHGAFLVMQSTGLKDKADKEIFEGDILKYKDVVDFERDEFTLGIVEHDIETCALRPREIETNHRGGRFWAYWGHLEFIEIIGNRFENPELLDKP